MEIAQYFYVRKTPDILLLKNDLLYRKRWGGELSLTLVQKEIIPELNNIIEATKKKQWPAFRQP